jgi:hypothetical protein
VTDRGFIILPRSLHEEPILRDPLYFYAYVWLLQEAAWKPRAKEVSNGRARAVIQLQRGQLSHSVRFMAKAWGVTVKRVRTILDRLETGSWIGTQTGTLQTVITVCNYDRLQTRDEDEGTQTGTQTGTQRARKGHKPYKGNKETRESFAQPELDASNFTDRDWLERLLHLERTGEWSNSYFGPRPGEPGCRVPSHLLVKPVNQTSIPR